MGWRSSIRQASAPVQPLIVALFSTVIITAAAWITEQPLGLSSPNLARALLIYLAVASFIGVVTRRVGFSFAAASFTLLAIGSASILKFSYMHENLHAGDLLQLSSTEFLFFAAQEPILCSALTLLLTFVMLVCAHLWRRDGSRVPRLYSLSAMSFSVVLLIGLASIRETDRVGHFVNGFHLTSLVTSLPDLLLFARGAKLPYAPSLNGDITTAPALVEVSLGRTAPKPTIIAILHESTVNPAMYKSGSAYRVPSSLFLSGDASQRKLIVETYGGGTWISEYGFLLGVSTHHFGPIRHYLSRALARNSHRSIVSSLRKFGYRTVAIYPADGRFANSAEFYRSLGFDEFHDAREMGLSFTSSDRVLYQNLLHNLRHVKQKNNKKPTFYFVLTTATHFPFTYAAMPERRAKEIRSGDDWAEYSRRLRLAADDLDFLRTELRKEAPSRFLLVGFGDHQPFLTAEAHSRRERKERWSSLAELRSTTLYDSFYRIEGVNFDPRFEGIPKTIEIGLLGTAIFKAAGLPPDPAFQLRQSLLHQCGGLIVRCPDQRAVIEFNTALVKSGDFSGTDISELSCDALERRGLDCLRSLNQRRRAFEAPQ